MDEKKILDLLREQTDAITPPESLSPDAIEQKLLELPKEESKREMKDQKKDTGKRRPRFPYRTVAELGSLAAIFVLGVTVYSQSRQITFLKEQPAAVQEQETEIQADTASAVADANGADASENEAAILLEDTTEAGRSTTSPAAILSIVS